MDKSFFDQDIGYRLLKKDLYKQYSRQQVDMIWKEANEQLTLLLTQHQEMSDVEKVHTHENIFPRMAMYRALQKSFPTEAMNIIEQTVKKNTTLVGKILHFLTAIPFMKTVFMKVFAKMTIEKFGQTAGFKQNLYIANNDELKFDILDCPYCRYCEKCQCKELTHTFCDSDLYCYGNLSGISFTRSQTLGTGGNCCDFHLKKESLDTIYQSEISDIKWILYDIPGNIGWMMYFYGIYQHCTHFLFFIPALLMIIGLIELISERILKLDRILTKRRLLRGFGALMCGGILGTIVSLFLNGTLQTTMGAMLCAIFAGLLYKEYHEIGKV